MIVKASITTLQDVTYTLFITSPHNIGPVMKYVMVLSQALTTSINVRIAAQASKLHVGCRSMSQVLHAVEI